ncbi:MAG TPA: PDZ domain-containing protein, partial [Blastocatellia bacterium]|nr:PDZ domain-containing protein [Blastocatellia bacterium]
MSKRVWIALGATVLLLMTTYFGLYVYSVFLPKTGSSSGFSATWYGTGEPRITGVDPQSPAAGLVQVGDEMIAIDGVKIRDDPSVLLDDYRPRPPGIRFTLTLRRAGQLQDVSILTIPHREGRQFAAFNYVNLLFLLTAWAIFLLRPADKQAWLLALMLATLVGLINTGTGNLPNGLRLLAGISSALGLLFSPIFVHFFLIFPEASPHLRRWPRLKTWIYLPYLLVVLPALAPGRVWPPSSFWLMGFLWFQYLVYLAILIIILYLAAGLICSAVNYRAASLIARRRLRVVMAGSAAGFLNLLLLIAGETTGINARLPSLWSWLDKALLITMLLIPLSFVYAIVRHKVIPVSLMIRRGVRYVLVSRGSVLIEGIAVTVTVTAMLTYVFSRFRPSGIVIGLVSAFVAIVTWRLEGWLHNKYLAPVIDRKFFRQAYDSQKIMAELADSLRSTTDLQHLCEQVATRIQTALQTESVVVLLRDEATGDYLSGYSCEYAGNGQSISCRRQFRLPAHGEFVAELKENSQPIEVDERLNGNAHSNSIEQSELREMKSALLLSLASKDGMPGVISLGPRLGDLPFSREDKHLLISVAGPTAFAIENSRLVERMIAEARRREEIEAENEQRAKELEEARQLQLSML